MAKLPLRAYNREIETMIDRGQLDEAIAHCHHILKTFPKHLETYRLLGKAYLEYKRYGDAGDIFSRVLISVPDDFVSQVGMSIISDEENRLDAAIAHMVRAFETQPSNSAIQSELQRLYGRRDGVQPPRIRMTRGALAHMYVQGELYPQAISEIKSVLKDDPDRPDMQALLARACYRSGLKNEAADVASALLKRYPYSLEANRVLAEILGADRPENAMPYRQRVAELDPYAAQVTGTIFQSSEVSDAAVTTERLDWNGQPVAMQSDWSETKAISLEAGMPSEEQPEWLRNSLNETTPPPASQPTAVSSFDAPPSAAQTPSTPAADDIPDFLRQAGWGQSTGAVDESKSIFAEEEATPAPSLEQGDLPDWVKAMKPTEPAPAEEESEELPDWINKIGTGALSSQGGEDQPDWMKQPETPFEAEAPATGEQPDWMKSLDRAEPEPTASASQAEDLDWLKGLGSEPEPTSPAAQADDLDWLRGPGTEPQTTAPAAQAEEDLDWLRELGNEPEATSSTQTGAPEAVSTTPVTDQPEWLNQFGAETEAASTAPSSSDSDFINQLTEEPILQTPVESTPSTPDVNKLGVSEKERDDSFAWLEALAAKQGATEGLLTKPEERLQEEPDWVKQAKGLNASQPPSFVGSPVSESVTTPDELGKSEEERDDSFAWLENLAAKQGATEGLLTQPEERLEQEPEWVRRAKDFSGEQPEVTPPAASLEELGKSDQERDDSFAWLENLAARQGASEGLLTKPEDRLEQEPEWVRQAKDLGAPQPPVTSEVEPESTSSIGDTDDTAAWLKDLDTGEKPVETEPAKDEIETWLENLEGADVSAPEQQAEPVATELPAWMNEIGTDDVTAAESAIPEKEAEEESARSYRAESPVEFEAPISDDIALPSWLNELEEEESSPQVAGGDEDLPAWLRGEESAPERPEPMHATDWKPFEEQQPKIIYSPPLEEEMVEPEPVVKPPLEIISEIFDIPVEKPVTEAQEQSEPEPESRRAEKAPQSPASPPAGTYQEPPTTRRGTGMLVTPGIDPVLGMARNEFSRSNISGALESYGKLIKKGRYLDEVIYDLRDALYRYPVEVSIWQSLGDAYMRANRLQDALDAYTKAEELLR